LVGEPSQEGEFVVALYLSEYTSGLLDWLIWNPARYICEVHNYVYIVIYFYIFIYLFSGLLDWLIWNPARYICEVHNCAK
jgi:hypothetical protein